ncbi:MAG: hypothetical protein LT080_03340 [Thiobacillus sp.]|nr:hypothetical protein [Thiobacillus sp.]
MTRKEFMQKIESEDGELKAFLESMSDKEWKDPDLCIVDDGMNTYWWPNVVDENDNPKGFTIG